MAEKPSPANDTCRHLLPLRLPGLVHRLSRFRLLGPALGQIDQNIIEQALAARQPAPEGFNEQLEALPSLGFSTRLSTLRYGRNEGQPIMYEKCERLD